nr:hypothetical protein [Tanacetum cinerariifolium]
RDTDMTNVEQGGADQQNASHESGFMHEEEDAHVTLTTIHDKTEGPLQSSFVSSDFTSKLLNLDNTGPDVNEIASLMDTNRIVDNYLASKIKEEVNVAVRLQSNKLKEEAEDENQEFFDQVDSNMKTNTSFPLKTRMKTPSLDQTEGRKEKSQARDATGSKNESGHIDDQPDNKAAPKHDWFQKPDKPPTPDRTWNKSKSVDFRPPQKWISTIAKECCKARQPPRTFDELMRTPIDFSAYVMNHLKIDKLTQEILVGPAFNMLKGTCKSSAKFEYHFEECYKAVNNRLDWHNPEGRKYPFDLSKPLPLIEYRGHQVVPTDYFIKNDIEYLKGGSSSSKYVTSTTITKAAKYDNIEVIEDTTPTL